MTVSGWKALLCQGGGRLPLPREPGPLVLAGICLAGAIAGTVVIDRAGHPPEAVPVVQPPRFMPSSLMPLEIGSLAPDFTLPELTSGKPVRLADFRGRTPVVLIFGSFT